MKEIDPTDLRGHERARAVASLQSKLDAETEVSDLKWLMKNRQGRRIVSGIIERSCVNKSIFNTNAMSMAFVSGRQLEGARLFEIINKACPDLYVLMTKEGNDRHANDE